MLPYLLLQNTERNQKNEGHGQTLEKLYLGACGQPVLLHSVTGTGTQNVKRTGDAGSLPGRSRPQGASGRRAGGGCAGRALSARTSSRRQFSAVGPSFCELLEILEASVQRGQAFRGLPSTQRAGSWPG